METQNTKEFATRWVEDGKPCRYRCGFGWKGARLRPLTNDKAKDMLSEYDFCEGITFHELIFGKDGDSDVLIFNEYTANDMW